MRFLGRKWKKIKATRQQHETTEVESKRFDGELPA
jgi:hypothetical protein